MTVDARRNHIRRIVGLPLLPMAIAVPAAHGAPAPTPGCEVADLTPATRTCVVANLAGTRSLNVDDLRTVEQRQAWVSTCLESYSKQPRRCDLRVVVPYDPSWEARFAPELASVPTRVGLMPDVFGQLGVGPDTLVWTLERDHPAPPGGGRTNRQVTTSLIMHATTGAFVTAQWTEVM